MDDRDAFSALATAEPGWTPPPPSPSTDVSHATGSGTDDSGSETDAGMPHNAGGAPNPNPGVAGSFAAAVGSGADSEGAPASVPVIERPRELDDASSMTVPQLRQCCLEERNYASQNKAGYTAADVLRRVNKAHCMVRVVFGCGAAVVVAVFVLTLLNFARL